tara:strand:+ start:48 stop:377 length:330 start_codon:yes stop_codon:yes gene_type:complete
MINKEQSQRGCWVLNPDTNQHDWRPVTIEYSDETFIAIKDEPDPGRGLREGELVHLSPLSESKNLNLEEGVQNKGAIDLEANSPSRKKESPSAESEDGEEKDAVANGGV